MSVSTGRPHAKLPVEVGDSLLAGVRDTVMEWLTSGLRRDVCVLLYDEERRAQQLKSALESRYDRRLKPDRFYGALDSLESKGYVETHVEGLEDVHSLTAAGRQSVETQFEWMRSQVEE